MATSDNATWKLLARLANVWHPGFHMRNARAAHMTSAIYGQLHHSASRAAGATDRELIGIWQSVTAANNWKATCFDAWDEGTQAEGRTLVQKAINRKKAAPVSRKATGKADAAPAAASTDVAPEAPTEQDDPADNVPMDTGDAATQEAGNEQENSRDRLQGQLRFFQNEHCTKISDSGAPLTRLPPPGDTQPAAGELQAAVANAAAPEASPVTPSSARAPPPTQLLKNRNILTQVVPPLNTSEQELPPQEPMPRESPKARSNTTSRQRARNPSSEAPVAKHAKGTPEVWRCNQLDQAGTHLCDIHMLFLSHPLHSRAHGFLYFSYVHYVHSLLGPLPLLRGSVPEHVILCYVCWLYP